VSFASLRELRVFIFNLKAVILDDRIGEQLIAHVADPALGHFTRRSVQTLTLALSPMFFFFLGAPFDLAQGMLCGFAREIFPSTFSALLREISQKLCEK
jgi:uncharacterized protein YggT (Ycf19 family)